MHSSRYIHRDLKPQNILVFGDTQLKIADFGLVRAFQLPMRPYTLEVMTRWYRSPELFLGATSYGCEVDVWSIGCILGEMGNGLPLFPGDSDIDTLFRIFRCDHARGEYEPFKCLSQCRALAQVARNPERHGVERGVSVPKLQRQLSAVQSLRSSGEILAPTRH